LTSYSFYVINYHPNRKEDLMKKLLIVLFLLLPILSFAQNPDGNYKYFIFKCKPINEEAVYTSPFTFQRFSINGSLYIFSFGIPISNSTIEMGYEIFEKQENAVENQYYTKASTTYKSYNFYFQIKVYLK